MEKIIHGTYINQGEDLSEVLKVRETIFGTGVDERDPEAINILVSLIEDAEDKGVVIGCGRLNFDIENFRFYIDNVGILPEYRRNGYGEFALRTLVDKVNQCGAPKVSLEKQKLDSEEAKTFFTKMFFTQDAEDENFLSASVDAFHTCCH